MYQVKKVILLLLLGDIFGLNTVNKILISYKIKSNNLQKLWRKCSVRSLIRTMNTLCLNIYKDKFIKKSSQSVSSHSRSEMTLILDGSIFRQWLIENAESFYGKYYSGQTRSAVYGFNLLLCGMTIDGVFYPLHFYVRKQKEKDGIEARRIVNRVHNKLKTIAKASKIKLPRLYLSVDSGFLNKELIRLCESFSITYIGVPKGNHIFYKKEEKEKLKAYKMEFKKREAAYLLACKLKGIKAEPYTMRIRVQYNILDKQEIVMLLFRVNNGKKVSAIFTTDLNVKGKTLRRRWFQRVKIEQFFRTIKHSLKIQQSTTKNYIYFVLKIAFFIFRALMTQLFVLQCKKALGKKNRLGFEGFSQIIKFNNIGRHYLDKIYFSSQGFCINNIFQFADNEYLTIDLITPI